MGKLSKDNLRKTIYYLKKNGLKNTLYAVAERLQNQDADSYRYVAPSLEELDRQRKMSWESPVSFSILVPLYCTPVDYFKEMIESVLAQTYPYFQLILLDASEDASILESIASGYEDERICYYKLAENKGIAENTNAGLPYATGEYIALLDHDDLLTYDALFEMAHAIKKKREQGITVQMIYTDEDKCDGTAACFYEPALKKDFDFELLLTNNYICHFTALKAELMQELRLRGEFNGAQDFDLILRVAGVLRRTPEVICHVPKVLYHWRCHTASTAANPASKMYAYEAGKRAVESFVQQNNWAAKVEHLKHLGFYRVCYEEELFQCRPEIGAIGGSLLDRRGKIAGGMMDKTGAVVYKGLRKGFSGYLNRAVLQQQAEALDIRCMQINPICEAIFMKSLKEKNLTLSEYKEIEENGRLTDKESDLTELSLKICEDLQKAGYLCIWNPEWMKKM